MDAPPNSRQAITRKSHVVFDARALKAKKIEKILGLDSVSCPIRLLDVGAGSGGIASYFSSHKSRLISVDAVDVADNREVKDGYRFHMVNDTTLPFPDATFDVIISNHVIEHVGNSENQRHHLSELRRVLKPGGIGYFAVPNRWMLIEPHYKLIFLSWLPRSWRSRYLQALRNIPFYDCEPLSLEQTEKLLRNSGFAYENRCLDALRLTATLELPKSSITRKFIELVPDQIIEMLKPSIPTLIYRLRNSAR